MNKFKSIRLRDGRILAGRINSVVIVGSTCAGKTTLVNTVRDSDLVRDGRIAVPARYITRRQRVNDSTVENAHVSLADFESKAKDGDIALRWVRPMEAGREVHYGFPAVPENVLPVYSGNNAIYANASRIWPTRALEHTLLVGVFAPDDVREQRLRARSPDLFAGGGSEAAHRLADKSKNMIPHVSVVVDNHGDLEEVAVTEIVRLVDKIAAMFATVHAKSE